MIMVLLLFPYSPISLFNSNLTSLFMTEVQMTLLNVAIILRKKRINCGRNMLTVIIPPGTDSEH